MTSGATPSAQFAVRTELADAAAMAAVRQARATIGALLLQLGQPVTAKVVGPLPGGLTQLATANAQLLALKLATPLSIGTQVKITAEPGLQRQPTIRIAVQPAPMPAPAASGTSPGFPTAAPPAGTLSTEAQPAPAMPATTAPAVVPVPGSPAAIALGVVTQAAAGQDSIVPLLARLAALPSGSLAALPPPVVEAALRLLAGRIDLNRGALGAEALKQAVLRSGVLANAGPAPGDTKSALLMLRTALRHLLGREIVPVAPVGPRPPPPLRGTPPRAPLPERTPAPDADAPRDLARSLLGHTEASLSRLRLLQMASQPAEAARAAPTSADPAEYHFELPLLLGNETGILQLQVERDGHNKSKPGPRGWRMRFAMRLSALGEVGADIVLLGQATSITIWAAESATADAIEAMLPELAQSLAVRGLDVGAVRLRRGAPATPTRAMGRMLDSAR